MAFFVQHMVLRLFFHSNLYTKFNVDVSKDVQFYINKIELIEPSIVILLLLLLIRHRSSCGKAYGLAAFVFNFILFSNRHSGKIHFTAKV